MGAHWDDARLIRVVAAVPTIWSNFEKQNP